MSAFLRYGERRLQTSNGGRDAFLDWFAAHRCVIGDPRWQFCKSEANRWTGCGVDLGDLLFPGEGLRLSNQERVDAALTLGSYVADLLDRIDSITRGQFAPSALPAAPP